MELPNQDEILQRLGRVEFSHSLGRERRAAEAGPRFAIEGARCWRHLGEPAGLSTTIWRKDVKACSCANAKSCSRLGARVGRPLGSRRQLRPPRGGKGVCHALSDAGVDRRAAAVLRVRGR